MVLMGKLRYSEENMFQCQFVQHKSYVDWAGVTSLRLVSRHQLTAGQL
jgi:hypothetical protein